MRSFAATARLSARVVVQLLHKPGLIPTALAQARALVPRRWWRSGSHLPIPPRNYVEFRQITLSGDAATLPEASDVVVWLEWCRTMHALRRSR